MYTRKMFVMGMHSHLPCAFVFIYPLYVIPLILISRWMVASIYEPTCTRETSFCSKTQLTLVSIVRVCVHMIRLSRIFINMHALYVALSARESSFVSRQITGKTSFCVLMPWLDGHFSKSSELNFYVAKGIEKVKGNWVFNNNCLLQFL